MNESEIKKAKSINHLAKTIIGKTLLGSVPVVGTLLSTLWNEAVTYTLEQRRKNWEEIIEARLKCIEKSVDELARNELFITSLLMATPIAIKTCDSQKREYLANAVINSLEETVDESKLIIFLSLMDKYTVWHIKFLIFFIELADIKSDTLQNLKSSSDVWVGVTFTNLLSSKYPQFTDEQEYVEKILRDLESDGLLLQRAAFGFLKKDTIGGQRFTKLGLDFFNFITL